MEIVVAHDAAPRRRPVGMQPVGGAAWIELGEDGVDRIGGVREGRVDRARVELVEIGHQPGELDGDAPHRAGAVGVEEGLPLGEVHDAPGVAFDLTESMNGGRRVAGPPHLALDDCLCRRCRRFLHPQHEVAPGEFVRAGSEREAVDRRRLTTRERHWRRLHEHVVGERRDDAFGIHGYRKWGMTCSPMLRSVSSCGSCGIVPIWQRKRISSAPALISRVT